MSSHKLLIVSNFSSVVIAFTSGIVRQFSPYSRVSQHLAFTIFVQRPRGVGALALSQKFDESFGFLLSLPP